jgi:glutamyl-tRNA reductase
MCSHMGCFDTGCACCKPGALALSKVEFLIDFGICSQFMRVGVLGLNHKTADLALREPFARAARTLARERALFFAHPTVLLSTCNRTEIYFSASDLSEAHSDLLAHLRRYLDVPFEHRLYTYFGIDCFIHLARVTAGLDSAIAAESEIQRQVKVAYATATEFLQLPSCMHYVFQKALRVGKQVRTQFSFHGMPSLCQAVWDMAGGARHVLLVGNSEINRQMARYLSRRGVERIDLVTRTPSIVPGCTVYGREHLVHWAQYDVVVAATNTDEYLISGPVVSATMLFDLSVPRSIDPALNAVNIETLSGWVAQKTDELQAADASLVEHVLKLCMPGKPRKWDHVPDVFHAGSK